MKKPELPEIAWTEYELNCPGKIQQLRDAGVSEFTIRDTVRYAWESTPKPESLEQMIRRVVREELDR